MIKPEIFVLLAAMGMLSCDSQSSFDTHEKANADTQLWKTHDMSRPKPPVITPPSQSLPIPPPSGAVILFDGQDLSAWQTPDGKRADWKLGGDYFEVAPGRGTLQSKESFGDVFIHMEWASPNPPEHTGQDRGNSGLFLMSTYELQILDSYNSETYADGQAGAMYSQVPPRFNASRPPGEWQSYDIAFRRPRFHEDGSVKDSARLTVIHNGVLIHNNEAYWGPTSWLKPLPYSKHADALPLQLQDHGSPVRFRNIWALPIPEQSLPGDAYSDKTVTWSEAELDSFTGTYERPNQNAPIQIIKKEGRLYGDFYWRPGELELLPVSKDELVLKDTDGYLTFKRDNAGNVTDLVFKLGGAEMPAKKAE